MIQIARNIILTHTKMLNQPTTTAPQQRIITISIQVAQAVPHTALIPHKLRTIPREARFQEQGRIAQYLRNATITVWGNRTYCIHKVDHRSCSFSDIQHQSLAKQPPFKHRQSTNNGQGQGNKFIKEKILNLLVHTDSRCKTSLHDPIQAAARSSLGYAILCISEPEIHKGIQSDLFYWPSTNSEGWIVTYPSSESLRWASL